MQIDSALELLDTFSSAKSEPVLAFAPGRINLIGEHTDYNQGFVFPMAIQQGITVAARPNGLETCRLVSDKAQRGRGFPVPPTKGAVNGWAKYGAAVAWALNARTCLDIAVCSNLPMSSGVSSSAALELACASLWNSIDNLNLSNKELALLSQRAENEFVGVNCGVMDQMASAMGKGGSAMLIDTRNLEITYAPIPDKYIIFVLDTGMPRSLAASAYNDRRATCEAAAKTLGVSSLREATLNQIETLKDPIQYRRAKHVVTEIQRCLDFADALNRGDEDNLGNLLDQSHQSLRADYEVSSPELDNMVSAANASPGCIGARMTGAGFGGCAIALVRAELKQEFQNKIEQTYIKTVKDVQASVFSTTAGQGARCLSD